MNLKITPYKFFVPNLERQNLAALNICTRNVSPFIGLKGSSMKL